MTYEELYPNCGIETDRLEFKGILNEGMKPDGSGTYELKWLKTIAAFANGTGGLLVVGVEDATHKIVALDSKTCDRQRLLIRRLAKQKLFPPLLLDPKAVEVKTKNGPRYLIECQVNRSRNTPVMVKERGAARTFVRRYGETDLATPEEIRKLVFEGEQTSFDSQSTDIPYNPSDFSLLKKLYSESHNGEPLLDKTLQLKKFFDSNNHLYEGALLFRDDCRDEKTNLTIVRWPGIDTGSSQLDRVKRYQGPIHKVIQDAANDIRTSSVSGLEKTATGETKIFSYPQRSIIEGISNAFAHRNYWMIGTQIQINLFIDRRDITSPGALLTGEFHDHDKAIDKLIPRHRNPMISSILALLGYIQGLGTGFDKIKADYAPYDDNHQPYISCDNSSFTLTLPNLRFSKGVLNKNNDRPDVYVPGKGLSDKELKILSYCYREKRTVKEISEKLGVSVSSYFRDNVLDKLVRDGCLFQIEGRPKKYYTVRNKVRIA